MKKLLYFSLFLFFLSCKMSTNSAAEDLNQPIKAADYFDTSRDRKIPVAFYYQKSLNLKKIPVLIFSHGYGRNNPDSNLDYNYLLSNLAHNGYFVVASIQHELPTDDLVPVEGNPQVVRRPNWGSRCPKYSVRPSTVKKRFSIFELSESGDFRTFKWRRYECSFRRKTP